jgi:hypothetical protein
LRKIQSAVKINNALGNFDLLVICGLCKLNPQCKPIHVRHIDYAQSANAPAYRADALLETTAAGTPDPVTASPAPKKQPIWAETFSVTSLYGAAKMAGRSESDYREVVFEREGKEPLHGFMRVTAEW